jgi:hypothetical protein
MSKHVCFSPAEAADRLAIRELVEAYAHCADRRDAEGQMSLFTVDTHFVVYMNAKDPTHHGRQRKPTLDACLSALPGHVRQVGRRMVIFRAYPLRRLAGKASALMMPPGRG